MAHTLTIITIRDNRIHIFPVYIRNILSKYIFQILLDRSSISVNELVNLMIEGIKSKDSWTSEIVQKDLDYLNSKIDDAKYFLPLCDFFTDLVKIVTKILIKLKSKQEIIMYRLANEIIQEGLLSYSKNSIRDITSQIFDYLKAEFQEFLMERFHGIIPSDRIKYTYDYLQEMTTRNEGFLLTTFEEYEELIKKYKPSVAPILWSCGVKNHEFWIAKPREVERGTWCGKCSRERARLPQIKYTYDFIKEIAKKKNGHLITTKEEYISLLKKFAPSFMPITWWCGVEGHKPFRALTNKVFLKNTWCRQCFTERLRKMRMHSYKDLKRLAESKGGRLITTY